MTLLFNITSFVTVRALTRAVSDLAESVEHDDRLCLFNASAATGVFPHSSFLVATFILSRFFLYEMARGIGPTVSVTNSEKLVQ